MALIVQKYGGTSVGDVNRIKSVAQRVKETYAAGNQVIVVVSARSGVWLKREEGAEPEPRQDARLHGGLQGREESERVAPPTPKTTMTTMAMNSMTSGFQAVGHDASVGVFSCQELFSLKRMC